MFGLIFLLVIVLYILFVITITICLTRTRKGILEKGLIALFCLIMAFLLPRILDIPILNGDFDVTKTRTGTHVY